MVSKAADMSSMTNMVASVLLEAMYMLCVVAQFLLNIHASMLTAEVQSTMMRVGGASVCSAQASQLYWKML